MIPCSSACCLCLFLAIENWEIIASIPSRFLGSLIRIRWAHIKQNNKLCLCLPLEPIKILYTENSQIKVVVSVSHYHSEYCGTTFLMRCVHAPLSGPFGGSLRHISSTRHSHLSFYIPWLFPQCWTWTVPRFLILACWMWLMRLRVCLYGGD